MAYEVFGADLTGLADPWYSVVVCAPCAVRVGRFRLEPNHGLDDLPRADTVIVPGWADVDRDPPADGRRTTTHWAHSRALAARYPRVAVDPDVLYVDNCSVLTSAGKAATRSPICSPG